MLHNFKKKSECNLGIVCYGNWKLWRAKCVNTGPQSDIAQPEYSHLELICRETPEKDSYYCKKHKEFELKFKFYKHEISINSTFIEKHRLS